VHLRRDMLGQSRRFGTGTVTVHSRVFTRLRIEVIAYVTLVRFDHVATESRAHRNALKHFTQHTAAECDDMTAVTAFQRLEHTPLVRLLRRKIKREAGTGAGEFALD